MENRMKCKKCQNDLFKIDSKLCCDNCEHNGAYSEGEYIYDDEEIEELGLTRDQVIEEGNCRKTTAFGSGCYVFICAECGYKIFWPTSEV